MHHKTPWSSNLVLTVLVVTLMTVATNRYHHVVNGFAPPPRYCQQRRIGWNQELQGNTINNMFSASRSLALKDASQQEQQKVPPPSEEEENHKIRPEYAALYPGTSVKIRVGNVTQGRKAWKKRRRSGSPLLVPCSILDIDRASMVRWNILYLSLKFGTPLKELQQDEDYGIGFTGKGVALSLSEIGSLYKKHLGVSLNKHAQALGYKSSRDLFRNLFHRKIQKEYGLRLWQQPRDVEHDVTPIWLVLSISRHRARDMASQAGLVQFVANEQEEEVVDDDEEEMHNEVFAKLEEDGGDESSTEEEMDEELFKQDAPRVMHHTGKIRVKNTKKNAKFSHKLLPLSAALRVSQNHVDEGRIENGSVHEAVVFSFDAAGDNGSPLLTCALANKRGGLNFNQLVSVRDGHYVSRTASLQLDKNLNNLKVGDGPYKAKVLRVSSKSHAAFVDCNVGRVQGKQRGGGMTRVLGMLRFDDSTKVKGPKRIGKSRSAQVINEGNWFKSPLLSRWRFRDDPIEYAYDDDEEEDDDIESVDDLFKLEIDDDDDEEENVGSDEITMEDMNQEANDEEDVEKIPNPIELSNESEKDLASNEELKELFEIFRDELSDEEADALEEALWSEDEDGAEAKHESMEGKRGTEEDITDLFSVNEDGLTYQDPVTGETMLLEDDNEDFDEDSVDDNDEDEFHAFAGMSARERLDAIAKLMVDEDGAIEDDLEEFEAMEQAAAASRDDDDFVAASFREPLFLKEGDTVDVYIKAVSKQSGRFMVTTDPAVQKPKDMKQKQTSDKKRSRLISQLGGMHKVSKLTGTECHGVVKATSNTGDWYYVQPELENVPVGVAKAAGESLESSQAPGEESFLSQGDVVRVRFDGIDESRGQLAMTVLEKLSP